MALRAGQIIDGYQIISELGRGGNGIVFKAQSAADGQAVAIKVPWLKKVRKSLPNLENFVREISAIARLEHPHIARQLRVGIFREGNEEVPYVMMELVEGVPAVELRKTSMRKIVEVMGKVCDAIYYAHTNRVIHCDLKPTNILIDRAGNPKVLDFGLARLLDEVSSSSGIFEGTPSYAAPEQFEGKADERTDIWTLGAILFDLLTGRPPFVAENWEKLTEMQQLFASQEMVLSKPTPRPSRLNPAVDPYLDELCAKALKKNPEARYQTAEDFAMALKKWGRLNRDRWLAKARRHTALAKFLPGAWRRKRIQKAYLCLETALSYDTATTPLKEDLERLLALEGSPAVIVAEMPLPKDMTAPAWKELHQNLQAMCQVEYSCLLPLLKVVAAVGEEVPTQVLLVHGKPEGRNLRELVGTIGLDEIMGLAHAIVELDFQSREIGIKIGIPEAREIFVDPTQIMITGGLLARGKDAGALQLASLLYQMASGQVFDGIFKDEKIPQRLQKVLREVLSGNSDIRSADELVNALEHSQEAEKILASGVLDRPFTFPPGEYLLEKNLCIRNNGHLKLQSNTVFRIQSGIAIECHGQITAKGIWDPKTEEGDIGFVPVDLREGWKGIHFYADAPQDKLHSFEGCVFQGGRGSAARDGSICGGAIHMEGGLLKIAGARFDDCQVEGAGGAICLVGCDQNDFELELMHAVFVGNCARRQGGAIAVDAWGELRLHKCRFEGNAAEEDGGSLYFRGKSAKQLLKTYLQKCVFSENRARIAGGALADAGYNSIRMLNCHCDNNVAEDNGGAIAISGKDDCTEEAHLQDCKFIGNRAGIRGGALSTRRNSRLNCIGTHFDSNCSERDSGGAIDMSGKGGNVPSEATFQRVVLSDNRCRTDGGAAHVDSHANIHFEECRFDGNCAEESSGGAVYLTGKKADALGEVGFYQCAFTDNRGKTHGGAVVAGLYSKSVYEECHFENNRSEEEAGAVKILGSETHAAEASFYKSTFVDNRCGGSGGGMQAAKHTRLSLEECGFERNRCGQKGGAVQVEGTDGNKCSEVKCVKGRFVENSSEMSAGAVDIGFFTRARLEECVFERNRAQEGDGGALQIEGQSPKKPSEVSLAQVSFVENFCQTDGGAIFADNYSLVLAQKSSFERNESGNSGGAIDVTGEDEGFPSKITLRQVQFSENRCGVDGGAINSCHHIRMVLDDCQFRGNCAKGNCGAVSIVGEADRESAKAKFRKVSFVENSCAVDGAALAAAVHTQMIFEECLFHANRAGGSCGAIGMAGEDARNLSEATFKDAIFSGNCCDVDGGAMVIGKYSRTKFEKCRWVENRAKQKTGGAILLLGKDGWATLADFYGCLFSKNCCCIDGGAINANIYTQTYFEKCRFEENRAEGKNGGAVVLLGRDGRCYTKATFQQVEFWRNSCKVSGGAINANDYTRAIFTDCLFEENQAFGKNGGAVLVLGEDGTYPSEVKFQNVRFLKNYCKGSGGAVNANVYTISSFLECRLEMNAADENGGGIFIRGLRRLPNKATIKKCRFIGNIAGSVGADVGLKSVKGVTEESVLKDNVIEIPAPDFQAEDE